MLHASLSQMTASETLDGPNKYVIERCVMLAFCTGMTACKPPNKLRTLLHNSGSKKSNVLFIRNSSSSSDNDSKTEHDDMFQPGNGSLLKLTQFSEPASGDALLKGNKRKLETGDRVHLAQHLPPCLSS